MEIIPTILVKDFEQVKEKIKKVEGYVNWVQLDIMDGKFVNNETWRNPSDLRGFKTKLKLEAHLMVENPEEKIDDWLEVVDRVIIHYEACNNPKDLIEKVQSKEKQIGLAINPETLIDVVKPFLNDLDLVLIMSVQPGMGGQGFKAEVLAKIKSLRETWPNGKIEVDGGINPETAKRAIEAGANLICAGTYIFNSKNIEEAIESLKK
jgi:ribulose-phosphate 3-epimerase